MLSRQRPLFPKCSFTIFRMYSWSWLSGDLEWLFGSVSGKKQHKNIPPPLLKSEPFFFLFPFSLPQAVAVEF